MCGATTLPWHPGSEITALGAAALAATEAHKAALRVLPPRNRTARRILEPSTASIDVGISKPGAPAADLGSLTIVSAGAVTNAALWTLVAIPELAGQIRVWDGDRVALSNLNRCLLFGLTRLDHYKVDVLAGLGREGLTIEGIPRNFGPRDPSDWIALVGADRIDARHVAQLAGPRFLVVGATEGAGVVLVSEHAGGNPCAACLHPLSGDEGRRVPTASFVSFWAGYLAAIRILRAVHAGPHDRSRQVTRCYPLQPQSTVDEPATHRPQCEVCSGTGVVSA
jgi:molybdopterin/thiamine biosynthesis adenylyltransferase